jgi:hypothetical protein
MRRIFFAGSHYDGMKFFTMILFVVLLLGFKEKDPPLQAEWNIPQQTFNPWVETGLRGMDTITVDAFVITKQITLGEYRQYLDAVKRDCTQTYYRTQLPDSTMCTPSAYKQYMEPGKYDAYPVSGVTWISATNYCRWKTKQDGLPDSMEYRLPFSEDWMAANRYLREQKIPNDFSRNYSDWLMNAYDESAYDFMQDLEFSYSYPDYPRDPPVLRRKEFIGNSFHYQHEHLMRDYGYSFRGYAYISFRMIRVKKTRTSAKLYRNLQKRKK